MYFLHAPKLFRRPKGGSQSETTEEEKSWGTLRNLQHFRDRRACQSSRMRLGRTHK